MPDATRSLAGADSAELDALLARHGLAGAYARGHLAAYGLASGGVQAWAGPATPPFRGALVGRGDIAWVVWDSAEAVPAVAACLARQPFQILSGPASVVAPVLNRLTAQAAAGADHCPFAVLKPGHAHLPAGPARRATPEDMEALIDFYSYGFYSLTYLPTRAAWRARLTEQLTYRTMFIVEQDDRIVAAAQSSAETPLCAMVGGVATLPDYRNRGLSGICVGALCRALFAAGRQEIGLFYMPGNTPAARVYNRLGFHIAGEWWLARLQPGADMGL